MAAQLWERAAEDMPGLDEAIAAGNFALLREWLRGAVHEWGAALPPRELLARRRARSSRSSRSCGI